MSAFSVVVALLLSGFAAAIIWASLSYVAPDAADQMAKSEAEPKTAPAINGEETKPATSMESAKSKVTKPEEKSEPAKPKDEITLTEGSNDQGALSPAPDPALLRTTPYGAVPKIDAKGRAARQVYARPYTPPDEKPLVAIVVSGLGMNNETTALAINELPPEVTLAFSPYAKELQRHINAARSKGHEVMLELPMEPKNYPTNDSGPLSLLVTAQARVNQIQTEKTMARVTGYIGMVNSMGAAFTEADTALRPVFQLLRHSGLIFLDRRSSPASLTISVADSMNLPRAYVNHWVDEVPTELEIKNQLAALEKTAFTKGHAVALTELYPHSANLVALWAKNTASVGLNLAPLSALVNKQSQP